MNYNYSPDDFKEIAQEIIDMEKVGQVHSS